MKYALDMTTLEAALAVWRREFGARAEYFEDTDGLDEGAGSRGYFSTHALERARTIAPRTRAEVIHRQLAAGRSGHARRKLMGERAGLISKDGESTLLAPTWAADPVAGTATRPDLRTPGYVSRPPIPPLVMAIQRAVMAMVEACPVSGHALQVHYCMVGTRQEKAEMLAALISERVSSRDYRDHVENARYVLLGWLASTPSQSVDAAVTGR